MRDCVKEITLSQSNCVIVLKHSTFYVDIERTVCILFFFKKYILYFSFTGSGVQDQLDALNIPPTPTEIDEQQQQQINNAGGSAANATTATATSAGTTTTGMGCQQCMGLSQLSFAASTMPPATVHSHVNPLHLIGSRNITDALSNFTEPGVATAHQDGGAGHQVSVTNAVFQDGSPQQHGISLTVGMNEVKDEDVVETK